MINQMIDEWTSQYSSRYGFLCGFIANADTIDSLLANTLCSEKNTHSHFLSYLHELFVDLNKNCSEYTQGLTDSDNVKIRYSLRSMT